MNFSFAGAAAHGRASARAARDSPLQPRDPFRTPSLTRASSLFLPRPLTDRAPPVQRAMASRGAGASVGSLALRNATQKAVQFVSSINDSRPRVQSLHRDMLRSVAWTKRAYNVPLPEHKMRSLITVAFREKVDVTDMHQINRLVALGRMELEETLQLWKGESHVQAKRASARTASARTLRSAPSPPRAARRACSTG